MKIPMKYIQQLIMVSALLITLSGGAVAERDLYLNDESAGSSGVVNPTGYYEKWTYFGQEVSKTDQLIAQSLRSHNTDRQASKPEKKPTPKPLEEASMKKPNPLKMDKEEFNKYVEELAGDAAEKPFLEPNADAPPAFKAMHACLQRGDYDCANKYAGKYAQGNILAEEYYAQIKKLTEEKLRIKGMMPASIDDEEPDYENTTILEAGPKDKKTENAAKGESDSSAEGSEKPEDLQGAGSVGRLPESVEQLLLEGEQKESQYVNKNRDAVRPPTDDGLGGGEVLRMLSIPEEKQRKQASDQYQGVLPKDEQGAVRVYFFFRKDDLNAYAMLPVLEKVYQAHKDDKRFILLAFSLAQMTNAELKAMKAKVKVNFPLRSGSIIAQQMDITSSPTTLIVAPSSGSYAKEEGIRGFGFIDELVRLVDGTGPTKRVPK
jgi:hypothetical protein